MPDPSGLFHRDKRDELIVLMKRFQKAETVPPAQWTPKMYAACQDIVRKISGLWPQIEGATWEWLNEQLTLH